MSKNVLVMYCCESAGVDEQQPVEQYPNAFIVQVTRQITCKHIREIFPWDRVPQCSSKTIRFALKANEETFWLDLRDDEAVPYLTPSTVSLRIS